MDYQKYKNITEEELLNIFRLSKTQLFVQHPITNEKSDKNWEEELIKKQEKKGNIYIGLLKNSPSTNINTYLFINKKEFELMMKL